MAEALRELRTAAIWIAFGLGLVLGTQPVWAYFLFGASLTPDDVLSLRCFSLPM
ncbi:hypothetical protein [Rhizobium grahamii]|uniref:Uncharacterized protein n=1 Tax=Rhizobium grahamii CCGE 502 TaxID=990285 RepID=S3IBL8_9HYPH|nr:hypothetical protein [Rhizobium grahamii]EPE96618.1 hypothetical protein RGCCGE502_19670 [Rhizobium grahamii CCGE 502]